MNIRHYLCLTAVAGLFAMALPACVGSDDSYDVRQPNALVTVRPDADGGFVMQLDDNTQLVASNLAASPFGRKEVRALLNYTEANAASPHGRVLTVHVNWIDSIRTKQPVESLGEEDAVRYGDDPIEIVRDWVTIAEDGYLTLRVRTLWGDANIPHALNLVTGTNPDNPYELEIRHNANGDTYGRWGDALIAFNLNGMPRDEAGAVAVTLRWKSFSGEKTARFEMSMHPHPQKDAVDKALLGRRIE